MGRPASSQFVAVVCRNEYATRNDSPVRSRRRRKQPTSTVGWYFRPLVVGKIRSDGLLPTSAVRTMSKAEPVK
jgi:hypothetical protein